jgi:hypothetical protein
MGTTRVSSIVETPDLLLLSGGVSLPPMSCSMLKLRTIVAEWLKHRFQPSNAAAQEV